MLALVTFYTLNILSEKRTQERQHGDRQRLFHIQIRYIIVLIINNKKLYRGNI
jgi:hypothetical protein